MLEFAICLCVLLLLFGIILRVGVWLLAQTEVTIEVRNKAWQRRHVGIAAHAFQFKKVGELDDTLSKSITEGPRFAIWGDPVSSHYVFGGSWDYHQIDMNKQPNWKLYPRAAEALDLTQLTGSFDVDENLPGLTDMINFDKLLEQFNLQNMSDKKFYEEEFDKQILEWQKMLTNPSGGLPSL